DDKGWDARKRAYCLKIQPATGSFARNLIYSTKPIKITLFSSVCYSWPSIGEIMQSRGGCA
ncbi:hypothetical protein, partial [Klebsiella pneumoniae]|uniref:hypothetical protein n=1 Tax=Klebsiella pneumoniae TaxID=573 RepID=UPI001CA52ED2